MWVVEILKTLYFIVRDGLTVDEQLFQRIFYAVPDESLYLVKGDVDNKRSHFSCCRSGPGLGVGGDEALIPPHPGAISAAKDHAGHVWNFRYKNTE